MKKLQASNIMFSLVLAAIAVAVSGTDACQRDYFLGAQSEVPTAEPTAAEETPTATPTLEGEETPEPTPLPTVAPTLAPTAGPVATATPAGDDGLLSSLSRIGEDSDENDPYGLAAKPNEATTSNWLGKSHSKESEAQKDSDADGFTDATEMDSGTVPTDPSSAPELMTTTRLVDRLSNVEELRQWVEENPDGLDSDYDLLLDDFELMLGTDAGRIDTDADGITDGKEWQVGSDPLLGETPYGFPRREDRQ